MAVIGWREVPIQPEMLGETAARTLPRIAQLLVRRPVGRDAQAFERDLLLARKAAERAVAAAGIDGFFVVSCSARTLIYKGFCLPEDLPAFYPDLRDPNYTSAIALFHQRYSTNTLPTWAMAQPFRFIAHNGEINTVQGNRNWMMARDETASWRSRTASAASNSGRSSACPAATPSASTTSSSCSTTAAARLPQALMMLVPGAVGAVARSEEMAADLRAFYDFHAGVMEQWDGPAALAFSDGVLAGATLDRNGLRPLRYAITADGLFIAGSEAGTVAIDQATVDREGPPRAGPDDRGRHRARRRAAQRRVEAEVAASQAVRGVAGRRPDHARCRARAGGGTARADSAAGGGSRHGGRRAGQVAAHGRSGPHPRGSGTVSVQRTFGYTAEDIRLIVQPMAGEGKEPTWSMGDDAPLAVLSDGSGRSLRYFRQRFAQVTNPAIDSLRERKVMALDAFVGPRGNLLVEEPGAGASWSTCEASSSPRTSCRLSSRSTATCPRRPSRRSSRLPRAEGTLASDARYAHRRGRSGRSRRAPA